MYLLLAWLSFFFSFSITSIQHYITCSAMDPAVNGCHQNYCPNSWFVYYKHAVFKEKYVNWWTVVKWCGLLWCFIQVFGLLFWWDTFTAEDPLVSKLYIATFLQICSDQETIPSTLHLVWPEVEKMFSKFSFLKALTVQEVHLIQLFIRFDNKFLSNSSDLDF